MKRKASYRFKPFEGKTENGRHLRITLNMMESKAWSELSSYAIQAYLLLKIKFTGDNQDNLSLTYKEGLQVMTKARFTKAIDELIEYGFIVIVKHRPNTRECNVYGLSDMWQNYETPAFSVEKRPTYCKDRTKKKDTS